jgi:nitrogen fixation protein
MSQMSITCEEFIKIIHDSTIGAKTSRGEYKVAVKNSWRLLGVPRIEDVYNLPYTLVARCRQQGSLNTKRMFKGLKSAMRYLPEVCSANIDIDNLRHYETYVEFLSISEKNIKDGNTINAIEKEAKYLMNIPNDLNSNLDESNNDEFDEYQVATETSDMPDLPDMPDIPDVVTTNDDELERDLTPEAEHSNESSDEESIDEMLNEITENREGCTVNEQRLSQSPCNSSSSAANRYVQQTELEMSRLRQMIRERESTIQLGRIKHTRAISERDNTITMLKNDMREMINHWQGILDRY